MVSSVDFTAGGTASGRLGFGGIGGGAGDRGRKGGGKKGTPEGSQGLFKYNAPNVKMSKRSALQLFSGVVMTFMTWVHDCVRVRPTGGYNQSWKARCMVRSRGMQGWFSGMNGIRIEGAIHRQQRGLSVMRIKEEG
ncbi:hypothetical protein EJ02DRAFT_156262 [Clathrospora elynae]|uniref:Uncharacterized protein n=1 Tax=Clathrospora elynae TaxID=706981 RepID=A0A6A5S480_9PLEO|nr:hypothetical protein EJ02DRAFT_156262 [Clathrospora elynae]